MFALYNYSDFPEVKVTFKGTINNEMDFKLFIEQWKDLYKDEKQFNFIFDMEDIGLVNPLYSYKMATFISELKKEPIQYLTHSKIINVNSFMKYLLYIVFNIQSPVAPVEILCKDGSVITIEV
jgi:hypothetical protein